MEGHDERATRGQENKAGEESEPQRDAKQTCMHEYPPSATAQTVFHRSFYGTLQLQIPGRRRDPLAWTRLMASGATAKMTILATIVVATLIAKMRDFF